MRSSFANFHVILLIIYNIDQKYDKPVQCDMMYACIDLMPILNRLWFQQIYDATHIESPRT